MWQKILVDVIYHAEAATIEQNEANNEGRRKERILTRGRGRTVLIARGTEGGRERERGDKKTKKKKQLQ